jgi:hypothetical protein
VITNATLLRIDAPAVNVAGDITYPTPGGAVSFRVCVDAPNTAQKWTIELMEIDVSGVLYVDLADINNLAVSLSIAGGKDLLSNAQVLLQLDGETETQLYQVRKVTERNIGLSHFECFVKAI